MRKSIIYLQKSIPLFVKTSKLSSRELKQLIRNILVTEELEPLSREEIKELKRHYKGRVRVFLTNNLDEDLIEFFENSSKSLQYALFKALNKKLQEV